MPLALWGVVGEPVPGGPEAEIPVPVEQIVVREVPTPVDIVKIIQVPPMEARRRVVGWLLGLDTGIVTQTSD